MLAWVRALVLVPGPGRKKSKSKIVLRRKKSVSGRPVCLNRSDSASHYDRTDFRLTQNSKPHIKERIPPPKTLKILENSEFTESRFLFSKGISVFSKGWPYFSTGTPHLYQQMLGPLVAGRLHREWKEGLHARIDPVWRIIMTAPNFVPYNIYKLF